MNLTGLDWTSFWIGGSVSILVVLTIVRFWFLPTIMKNFETLENYITDLQWWVLDTASKMREITERVKVIDSRGSFESDDEIGFFFQDLKKISADIEKIAQSITIDNPQETTERSNEQ